MNKIMVLFLAVFLLSCSSNNKVVIPDYMPGPKAIVYKTKADYYDKVPIFLSEDKKTITGFPHPKDLMQVGQLALPTKLIKGYLLDNRGVNANTAFLKYSYQEYADLQTHPNLEKLYQSIIDKDPILEIYDCGLRSDYETVGEINQLIKKRFKGAKKVK
ncbi:MAG: hypothetical protein U9N86_11065 [Bacteroidota bacterium]|nr:hypothetical protein [Bacteroidota bacterium]